MLLTVSGFLDRNWEQVIDGVDTRECGRYRSRYFERAREAQTSGDEKGYALFALLERLASLHLDPDAQRGPFMPKFEFADSRSAIVDDFGEGYLQVLLKLAPQMSDAEIRARIADVLWIRRRDHRMLRMAIRSYLESSEVLEDPERWLACTNRIKRAMQLAPLLDRKSRGYTDAVARIEELLDRYGDRDAPSCRRRCWSYSMNTRRGDPARYSALAESIARRAEETGDWHRAEEYWLRTASWRGRADDEEGR